MLNQPLHFRNMAKGTKTNEQRNFDSLNEALGEIELTSEEKQSLMWVASWDISTVKNIISAFRKARENL